VSSSCLDNGYIIILYVYNILSPIAVWAVWLKNMKNEKIFVMYYNKIKLLKYEYE